MHSLTDGSPRTSGGDSWLSGALICCLAQSPAPLTKGKCWLTLGSPPLGINNS